MSILTRSRNVAFVLILCLSGCRTAPELRPRLILQGEPTGDEFWLAAPYVLAVKVSRAEIQGSPEPIFRGGPKSLQLIRFTAAVDNVIKGELADKTVSFFFFVKLDQNPRYYLYPGKRYIVSLRREGGVLRSWADASQLAIWVHSGSHNQADLPVSLGPAAMIAYILLTPGADCDLREFQNTLSWPRYGDPEYVDQRLKELQLSPDRNLRDSACITSAVIFWHRPKCLELAANSSAESIRSAAERFLRTDDVHLAELLRKSPFSLFPQPWTSYFPT